MLILKVENFDRLADGGPLSFRADRRGFDFGRDQHLDWTLPDPSRKVSGKHCEIRFHDGAYWLHDVSTNGTFVNRSPRRVQSPYRLGDGDELNVGDYIISAAVSGIAVLARSEAQPYEVPGGPPHVSEDMWRSNSAPPPPISRQDLMPEMERPSRANDFINSVADLPPVPPGADAWRAPPPPPQQQAPVIADPWAPTGFPRQQQQQPPPPPPPPAAAEWSTGSQVQRTGFSISSMAREVPFSAPPQAPAPLQVPRPPLVQHHEVERPAAQPISSGPSPEMFRAQFEVEFIRRIAAGAGVPEAVFAGRKASDLAFELGEMLRLTFANLMQLLKARAEAKNMARSGARTMIEPRENNALKFTPNPEAAFAIIFGPGSSGYLDGRQTLERSFDDLKVHEAATFAAMQQAAMHIFENIAPEAVEEAAGGGSKMAFLSGGKSKNWELFVERWNARAGADENGMLDAFLDSFAAYYDDATPKKRS